MRKRISARKFGRSAAHRKALMSNLASSLIEHKRIKTAVNNVIKLKKRGPVPGTVKKVYDYKWLPKQTHDYVDR